MVATTRVTTDRVTRVKIDPYDQVFALTQKLINDGLETNWLTLTQADPKLIEPFRAADLAGVGGLYKAIFRAPQVLVEAGFAEDLSSVMYLINFESGTFKGKVQRRDGAGQPIWDPDTDEPVFDTTTISMKDWRLAFDMELGMTLVERTSNKFKKLNLKAGEYSLNELSAKFETAVFNPKGCEFGDKKKWVDLSEGLRKTLKYLIESEIKPELLNRMKAANTIGYALKTDQPEGSKPKLTFQPNMIQYQTYPYVPPGSINYQPISDTFGNSQLNYLLYAETTGDRGLPDINKRTIPRNGNWTDGTIDNLGDNESGDYGSFYMSRQNFFDRYLLKKLSKLNRVLEPWHTYVKCEVKDWANPQFTWSSDMGIGNRSDKSADDSCYDFTLEQTNPPVWSFGSRGGVMSSDGQAGKDGWSAKVSSLSDCACYNRVSFVPGTDLIEVNGTVKIGIKYNWFNFHFLRANEERTETVDVEITWSMTLDLEAVSDGGLQIYTTFQDPKIQDNSENGDRLNDWLRAFTNAMTTAMENQQNIRKELAEDLAGQQGLVLPAGGVFYFKNPILTQNGDLTCSVSYKDNITPGSMLDPNDATPVNGDAKDRLVVDKVDKVPIPHIPTSVDLGWVKD